MCTQSGDFRDPQPTAKTSKVLVVVECFKLRVEPAQQRCCFGIDSKGWHRICICGTRLQYFFPVLLSQPTRDTCGRIGRSICGLNVHCWNANKVEYFQKLGLPTPKAHRQKSTDSSQCAYCIMTVFSLNVMSELGTCLSSRFVCNIFESNNQNVVFAKTIRPRL